MTDDNPPSSVENFATRFADMEAALIAQHEMLKILRWRVYDQHRAPTKARTYDRSEAFKRLEAAMSGDPQLDRVKHFYDDLLEWRGRRDYTAPEFPPRTDG